MASSSCSYAATALAKSLFQRGADFTAAMVFMFASTNLVAELGIVLWLLIGWHFTLAEFAGGLMTDATIPASMRWIPKGMQVDYLGKRSRQLATAATTSSRSTSGRARSRGS